MGQETWVSVKGLMCGWLDPDNSASQLLLRDSHPKAGKESRRRSGIPGGARQSRADPLAPETEVGSSLFKNISFHTLQSIREDIWTSSALVSSDSAAHRPLALSFPAHPSSTMSRAARKRCQSPSAVRFVVCSHRSSRRFKAQHRC